MLSNSPRLRMRIRVVLFGLLFASVTAGAQNAGEKIPDLAQLNAMAARFAPTPLRVDTSHLSSGDQKALVKLIEAARILNPIYMNQLWSGDLALAKKLQADKTALGQARLHYFRINKGPWSDLDEFRAFLPGVPARKPLGANFYPPDMTKAGFENWVATLAPDQQEQVKGFFTVIRQQGAKLAVVPYTLEYRADLEKCAALLREAAALTDNASLQRFLTGRADAFLSNDYYESDVAWMDLDAPLDITIGPYETYTDELFGYKAAYEAYINVRDEAESAKLAAFGHALQTVENNLPEDPQYRNPKLGAAAPIRVVNQIIASGDGAHGITTAAYNLPNDERVVQQKGSKRVMLKNVQQAKFRTVLIPIASRMIIERERADVSFEQFFTHILAHELMHGLGPHQITVNGQPTNPRQQLKELYSAIEEAKADATGLWALQYMMDHAKELNLTAVLRAGPAAERQLYTTFLASSFRSLRFGSGDAHGKGMAMQFNYIVDRGGFVQQPDGTFAVDFMKIKQAVSDLTHDLLTVEATGDYAGAQQMLALAVIRPNVARQLTKLANVPVDIEPIFVTADELAPEAGKQVTKHKGKSSNSRRKRRRRQ
jgi:peptidase M49-like protein